MRAALGGKNPSPRWPLSPSLLLPRPPQLPSSLLSSASHLAFLHPIVHLLSSSSTSRCMFVPLLQPLCFDCSHCSLLPSALFNPGCLPLL